MKRSKIYVAITGGIGSGKSCVAKMISELGYPVFSADAIARAIYDEPEVFERVAAVFPQCIERGQVDRKKLAEIVFKDREKLAFLDSVTHPFIMRKLFAKMEGASCEAVFAEVPLLFESGSEKDFDRIIVVIRDLRFRVESVMKRDGLTKKEVEERIKNQYDYEKNLNTEHTILYNDGDLLSLQNRVTRIVHEIIDDIKK